MKYAFIGCMEIKEGKRAQYVALKREFAHLYLQEPGTEVYVFNECLSDPNIVWTYEVYKDEAAFLDHRNRPEVQVYRKRMQELRAVPNLHFDVRPIYGTGLAAPNASLFFPDGK